MTLALSLNADGQRQLLSAAGADLQERWEARHVANAREGMAVVVDTRRGAESLTLAAGDTHRTIDIPVGRRGLLNVARAISTALAGTRSAVRTRVSVLWIEPGADSVTFNWSASMRVEVPAADARLLCTRLLASS